MEELSPNASPNRINNRQPDKQPLPRLPLQPSLMLTWVCGGWILTLLWFG